MAYKISYGAMPGKSKSKQNRLPLRLAAGVFAIVLAITLRFLYPEETRRFSNALFPMTAASSQEALAAFAENIRAGESFGDAATAFCQEILDDADIS